MRVLLVVPSGRSYPRPEMPTAPHPGIAYLAAVLDRENHETRVLDMRIHRDVRHLKALLHDFDPQLVGITCYSTGHKLVYELIEQIKRIGDYKVVIGGPHVSAVRKRVLERSKADLAVKMEGEYTLVELCAGKDYKNIKGLIWRNGNQIIENEDRELIKDLDKLPFPAYEKFELDKYTDKKLVIVTSRGCYRRCIFCSIRLTMGHGFRGRSPENVVDEIEYWYNSPYHYRYFQFADDCFTADIKRAMRICDLIIERGLKITWELRNGIIVNLVNRELLEKMKRSGCSFVAFGVESADETVLKNIKKGITLKQARKAITMAHEVGIKTSAFFMIGNPGDNFEKFERTLKFAKSLPLNEVRFYNTIPFPGTELFDWVNENARLLYPMDIYLNEQHAWSEEPVFETDDFRDYERKKACKMGESLAMKSIAINEFGKILGLAGWALWSTPFFKRASIMVGARLWVLLRRMRSWRGS